MRVNGNYRGFGFGLDLNLPTDAISSLLNSVIGGGGGAQDASHSENFPDEFFKKYPPAGSMSLQDKILLGGLGVLIVGGGLLFLKRRSAPSREG